MGLLDQILGGLTGGAGRTSSGGGLSTGRIVSALLPIVLGMLANRQRGPATGGAMGAQEDAGGGVGGLGGPGGLGGLFGGGAGGGAGGAGAGAGGMGGLGGLAGMGGLGGLLEMFKQKGYGQQAHSWVSTGPNEPLPSEALSSVFGQQQLSSIAAQAGLSEDETRMGLSELLPEVVNHLTPDGRVPEPDQLAASVDEFARQARF